MENLKRNALVGLLGAAVVVLAYWAVLSIKVVGNDDVLILHRRYFGSPLPPHKTVADGGEKGPLRNTLGAGFHFVPAWIYATERAPVTRIEKGTIGVLIALSGRDLGAGKVIADPDQFERRVDGSRVLGPQGKEGEKGIREEILKPGVYRINPYEFRVEQHAAVEIPSGKVGVLIQLFGAMLPPGEIIAKAEAVDKGSEKLPRSLHRGVLEPVLPPGTYQINPYLYRVEIHPEVVIDAGSLGVQLRKVGTQPASEGMLVADGERGIQSNALSPGRYYLNPYVTQVIPVSIRTQKYEIKHIEGQAQAQAGIQFPSMDALPITADLTLQWLIPEEKVALIYATLGDIDRIDDIMIEQNCHSVARLKGSNHTAKDFISGETRKLFENDVHTDLEKIFAEHGLLLERTLVRNIIIPKDIETPIQDARVAIEERAQFLQQTKESESEALRQKEKKLAEQRTLTVGAQTVQIKVVNEAKKKQKTEVVAAEQKLEVAKVKLEAAKKQAEALVTRKKAEANVVLFGQQAQAAGFKGQVAALGDGGELARLELWKKIAPALQAVIPMGEGTLWTGGEFLQNVLKLKGLQALKDEPATPAGPVPAAAVAAPR